MKKILSKFIFYLIGWKVVGERTIPNKCIVLGVPHTSNWDFLYGRCFGYIVGVKPKYLIKKELFKPILGSLIKWNGGISIDRNGSNSIVSQVAEMFKNSKSLILAIAPEGTRKPVEKWKSGFYFIADEAQVPIALMKIDYKNKEVGKIGEIKPTGDFEKDMTYIQEKFSLIKGKLPENYNPKIF